MIKITPTGRSPKAQALQVPTPACAGGQDVVWSLALGAQHPPQWELLEDSALWVLDRLT